MNERILQQMKFLIEIDKLKSVDRKSSLADGSRLENTAEHSWHFAMMTFILAEHAMGEDLDLERTVRMALVHDLVEIDAGDTYCYDESAHNDKTTREKEAAKRIFGILPDDQGKEIWNLWEEFEEGKTQESKYARCLDRLNPFFLNHQSKGISWKKHGITKTQVLKRMGEVETNLPKLWPTVTGIIDDAIQNGWIIDR